MASVADAFDAYLGRIELDATRVGLASQRYNAVKRTIETAQPSWSVRQIGSFARKTKVRPQDPGNGIDVDVVVSRGETQQFAQHGSGLGGREALNELRQALTSNDVYDVMEPKNDAPTVVLKYADPDGFRIELVPAFVDQTGTFPHYWLEPPCYLVPNAKGDWVPADYDYDARLITGLNQSAHVQGTLIPLIKMAKVYLRLRQVPLKSFHVELLVALTLPRVLAEWESTGKVWGYHHAFAAFLFNVSNVIARPAKLPGSHSPPVDSGIATDELRVIGEYLADKGHGAWDLCKKDGAAAIDGWRDFFGDPFPAR